MTQEIRLRAMLTMSSCLAVMCAVFTILTDGTTAGWTIAAAIAAISALMLAVLLRRLQQ